MTVSEKVARLMLEDHFRPFKAANVNYSSHRIENNKLLIKFDYHQFDVRYREKYISEISFDHSMVIKYNRESKLEIINGK